MKAFKDISNIHFIGIGGIGMSALARYFKKQQKTVAGYDKTRTDLTDELVAEGIEVYFEDDLNHIDKSAELVVYTPAIPDSNTILSYYKNNDYKVYKRSEVLQQITEHYKTIAIAGTHGKTTITALTSWIAQCSDLEATSFIGGICTNYNSNFVYGEGDYIIVEADEYDRSFLKLQPGLALISAIDADHLDIYDTYENLTEAYQQFADSSKNGQVIVHHYASNKIKNYNYTYTVLGNSDLEKEVSFFAYDVQIENGKQVFSLNLDGNIIKEIAFSLPGKHNIENATAAAALNYLAGSSLQNIKKGLSTFKGIKRRFEYIINTPELVVIDDYAHHPVELIALLETAKNWYPDKKISIVFQPHLYSRTRDFADEFATSLSKADEVILLDIYPARELPIEGVNAHMIVDKMNHPNVIVCSKDKLIDELDKRTIEVLLIAGAGDIDQLIPAIKQFFQTKNKVEV